MLTLLAFKELLYISVIAGVVFWLAKPVALNFMAPGDFARRRNLWFALTAIAFLSPSFWLFAILAMPLLLSAGRKDPNPAALYLLLLQVIPPIEVPVPMVDMPYLFKLDHYLLLSFFVMVPLSLRILRRSPEIRRLGAIDVCLLAYGLLTAVLYVHSERPDGGVYPGSATESLRRAFVFFFITYVPFYSISRSNSDRESLAESMASFCLACAVLSAIAVFESARSWLLYGEMPERWGYPLALTPYLARGASLRAMASTGHSMSLGYVLVIAVGFWMYLRTRVGPRRHRIGAVGLLWSGLLAAYTRGAWVGGALIYFSFAALQPKPLSKLIKVTGAAAIVAILVYVSPLGEKIISVLPFFGGHVDAFNVVYRQHLWDRAWQIIQRSPMLGDDSALLQMQDLRQGQGIIDLVNTYGGILLDNGFVGLSLFLTFIMGPLLKVCRLSRQRFRDDPDFGMLGAAIACSIISLLLMLENGSFGGGPERMFYVLGAFGTGYKFLAASERSRNDTGRAAVAAEQRPTAVI